MRQFLAVLAMVFLLLFAIDAEARDGRNANEVKKFRRANPCPVTGETRGRCHGYEVDHVVARRCGGPDKAANMQWLAVREHKLKTAREARTCRAKWR